MGGKKREDSFDLKDNESEISDNRPSGMDAELFSQPIGFMPKFPPPPKYIKVKAQNRKRRDFDKVFLSQVLLGPTKNRATSDEKIVSISDVSQIPATPGGPPANRAIWAMEFSRDGRYLAAAGQDKKVRVWQVISSPEDREAEEKDFSAGNAGGENVRLNAPVFRTKLLREYDGHTSSILDLSWSKNNFLLSSSMDKTVRLYHVSRTECLCAFKHNDFVTSVQFHPRDDRFFLAGSLDSKLRLWSIPDKSVAFWAQVPDMVTAVAFTPDGKTAIAGCLNGLCILYDTEGLKAHSQIHVRSARGRNAKGSKITGIDTISLPREHGSPDIKLLITSNDSRVRMYNLKDRNLEIKFRGNENASSQIHATFSDDGEYVICGSEDRKVYMWPTGPVEKQDPEKRPVEVFEAHSAMVTTAILAPAATRQALARSGDPLYDLCNPPPVTLLSRTDSAISSRAPTDNGSHSAQDQDHKSSPRKSGSPRRIPESPAYIERSKHVAGNIIVTADYSGQIKVFRQDCAFEKRRQESWDNASTFSKKMLGRSGSVQTRTSASSNTRGSLNLSNKNPSNDRIINWRNSIASNGSTSMANSLSETNINRTRSNSPKKTFQQRLSFGRNSSSNANPSTLLATAQISPPMTPPEKKRSSSLTHFHTPPTHRASTPNPTPGLALTQPSPTSPEGNKREYRAAPHSDDPLWLQGQQSYQYYNVAATFGSMAMHNARTPGLLGPDMRNPISRQNSVVSQLSSEIPSSGQSAVEGQGEARRESVVSNMSAEEEELKCEECGSQSFKAVKNGDGQMLRCTRCGKSV
jgi:WD repeat-containing protein 44